MLLIPLLFTLLHFCSCRDVALNLEHMRHEARQWSPDGRIINGGNAVRNSAKYMAYLEIQDNDPRFVGNCGGTLISKKHVLTAAHCFENDEKINFIYLGAHNVSDPNERRTKVFASKYKKHPSYDNPTNKHDLAVVLLDQEINPTNTIKIVNLELTTDKSKTYKDLVATTYGWGLIQEKPTEVEPDVLQTIDLKVISKQDCLSQAPRRDVYPDDGEICTGGRNSKNKEVGTCVGDSGGPLMLNGKQIGIVSRGTTNDCDYHPSVYVRVAYYRDWIDQQIRDLK